jgi:hypothetical protein
MEEKALTLARELQMERDRVDDLYSKEDRDIKALARECERCVMLTLGGECI